MIMKSVVMIINLNIILNYYQEEIKLIKQQLKYVNSLIMHLEYLIVLELFIKLIIKHI
jgi:hypothetical protein